MIARMVHPKHRCEADPSGRHRMSKPFRITSFARRTYRWVRVCVRCQTKVTL